MLGYLDPKHPYRASKEAQKIIDAADSNSDGVLEVEEFLKVCIGYYSMKKCFVFFSKGTHLEIILG